MQELNLENIDESMLDSLTQIISRQYIIEIANKLIEEKKPFSLMILDLDNFKQINDSFGHLSGDFILRSIGDGLKKIAQEKAYIGRYGGDEFLLLLPGIVNYNDVHIFLEKLYEKGLVFRKYYNDGLRDIYITATLGCSKYPEDSSDYEELFSKADKALYRGKVKGRNCYIIYVESKHANIVVREKAEKSLVERFNSVNRLYDIYRDNEKKIKHTMDFLYSELHCTGAYFLTPEKRLISNFHDEPIATGLVMEPHLEILLNGDRFFYDAPLTKYKSSDPVLSKFCNERSIFGLMVAKVGSHNKEFGYIMVYESSITRMWQDTEVALLMYVAALLENEIRNK